MKEPNYDPIAVCKEKGVPATVQRIAILKAIRGMTGHPSVEEIYHQVRNEIPTISLATVYNNLQLLSEEGLIPRPLPMPNLVRYETTEAPHHHLACIRCHKIVDLPPDAVAVRELPAEMNQGFRIISCRLVFEGICPDCQNPSSSS